MATGLSTELTGSYSELMLRMAACKLPSEVTQAFRSLEKIDDPARDIRAIFSKDPELLQTPQRWIDVLRLLRFAVGQRDALSRLYDGFVQAYERLTHLPAPDADEKKLKEEISSLMYTVDENSGKFERLSKNLFSEAAFQLGLGQGMGQTGFFHATIDNKIKNRIHELAVGLIQISIQFDRDYRIALALERMQKLILGLD